MTGDQFRWAVARKRDGAELTPAQWREIVVDACSERIDEAALAALLMACVVRGMTDAETFALTEAFIASGETLVAPDLRTVDKHSSGGVADSVSLVVVPIVAACGVPVAKLSGRALGHTGGTLDKLEALAGVRTALSPEEFFTIVARVGCAIAAQSERLVPADKYFYALRDRTSTVPSPGLIAASIVSKKIAGGARGIVFDVKYGRGAFVVEPAAALDLARQLVALARGFGRRARALVSDMNEPLGRAIGTGLELCEARDVLTGAQRDPRLLALCEEIACAMLAVAEGTDALPNARERYARALASGAAYERFERMLVEQGARTGALAGLRPHATSTVVRAERGGYVGAIAPVELGERARELVAAAGALAGIVTNVRVGDAVVAGDALATIYGTNDTAREIQRCFTIQDAKPEMQPLVYGEVAEASMLRAEVASVRSTLDNR